MIMPSSKKVRNYLESANGLKTHETNYLMKVENLKKRCQGFAKCLSENKECLSPGNWAEKFKNFFGEMSIGRVNAPMKANRLTSRTSRVLHDIYKKLSKIKDEKFDVKRVNKYKEAFDFKEKTAKAVKGKDEEYIKRSAIDNYAIVNFFTGRSKGDKVPVVGSCKINAIEDNIPELIKKMSGSLGDSLSANSNNNSNVNMNEMLSKSQELAKRRNNRLIQSSKI